MAENCHLEEENRSRVAARDKKLLEQGRPRPSTPEDFTVDLLNRFYDKKGIPVSQRRCVFGPTSTDLANVHRSRAHRSNSYGAIHPLPTRPVMTGKNYTVYPIGRHHTRPLSPPSPPSQSLSGYKPEGLPSFPSRGSSIRIVEPDFALPTSDTTSTAPRVEEKPEAMYLNHPYRQKPGESSRMGARAGQQADNRSRVEQLRQQLFNINPESSSGPRPAAQAAATEMRAPSAERGRDMRRRYQFVDDDDETDQAPAPAQEPTGKKNEGKGHAAGTPGREDDITTMTELMKQCNTASPSTQDTASPQSQQDQQQQGASAATAGAGPSSAAQTSQAHSRVRRRPEPLDLQDPAFLGMVNRNARRYHVEHNPVQSSRAEVFQFPYESSSIYSDEAAEPVEPVQAAQAVQAVEGEHIIRRLQHQQTTERSVNFVEAYDQWRQNQQILQRSPSEGSINIRVPTAEEDSFTNNREQALRQLSGEDGAEPVASAGLSRSATMRHLANMRGQGQMSTNPTDDDNDAAENQNNEGHGRGIRRSATTNDIPPRGSSLRMAVPESPFTPLTPFIMRASGAPENVNVQGGNSKNLFGEGGWLEDTAGRAAAGSAAAGAGQKKPKVVEKTNGFVESIKRMAREFADGSSFNTGRHQRSASTSGPTRLTISLDPREQCLLYGELEFSLNTALDVYIKTQLNGGRLDAYKLNRVVDGWTQKGRPKVLGFRYDVETQVELVAAHVDEFRFYGELPARGGRAAVLGLLQAMRVNSRYMRVRTYCQPDTVIAKQILDSQALLRLVGSPETLQRPLEEVAQFFKVAVDRRRVIEEAPPPRDARRPVLEMDSISSSASSSRSRFMVMVMVILIVLVMLLSLRVLLIMVMVMVMVILRVLLIVVTLMVKTNPSMNTNQRNNVSNRNERQTQRDEGRGAGTTTAAAAAASTASHAHGHGHGLGRFGHHRQ
ncbi:hypothetical protein F5Y17DRAFT_475523 [Xylariaceae sp. FL0594]|nr:hypothetical protein F5Y17DRAFT_475523 [Xylariaceae sp. FL0594]